MPKKQKDLSGRVIGGRKKIGGKPHIRVKCFGCNEYMWTDAKLPGDYCRGCTGKTPTRGISDPRAHIYTRD